MTSKLRTLAILSAAIATLLLLVVDAKAQAFERPPDRDSSGFHFDAEIDPLAYAFGGYSLHVGLGYGHVRLGLGAFALDTPGFLESEAAFETSRNGYGLKLQVFPFAEQRGAFIGLQAELVHELVESAAGTASHRSREVNLGVNAGFRFMLGDFFVTPWLLVNYAPGANDVRLDGKTHQASRFFVTPTVHLGYRFR